jgi:hypothetical protein
MGFLDGKVTWTGLLVVLFMVDCPAPSQPVLVFAVCLDFEIEDALTPVVCMPTLYSPLTLTLTLTLTLSLTLTLTLTYDKRFFVITVGPVRQQPHHPTTCAY